MRKILGLLVVLWGIVSIAMTARYGFKQADNEIDGYMSAVMFGTISLCAIFFDGIAVRLWFNQARRTAFFIGALAALAFVVTFSNSLGSIATRIDAIEAQRQGVTETRADDRKELARLEQALANLGKFTPTDAAAVDAAKRAADTAKSNREAECNKRGPNCRQRESDEQLAASNLATVTANKSATDRAHDLEEKIGNVRAALGKSHTVANTNPLGHALSLLVGSAADVITARMQAIIALVFELCIVGAMVAFETLGHVSLKPTYPPNVKQPEIVSAPVTDIEEKPEPVIEPAPTKLPPPPKPTLATDNKEPPAGPIIRIMTAALEPAKGQRAELVEAFLRYAAECRAESREPVSPSVFIDAMAHFCNGVGIKTKIIDNKLYLLNVRLTQGTGHEQQAV